MLLSACAALWMAALVTSEVSVSTQQQSTRTATKDLVGVSAAERSLAGTSKLIYTIPSFGVLFESTAYVSPTENWEILEYTMREPLEMITTEYLLESIKIDISKNYETSDLMEFVRRHFLTVHLVVTGLQMTPQERSDGTQRLQVVAEIQGTAAFRPVGDTGRYQATNAEVWDLMGDWMDKAFHENGGMRIYEEYLRDSTNAIVRQHQQLTIQTDVEPGTLITASDGSEDDSGARIGMIVAITLVSLAVVVATVFLLLPYTRKTAKKKNKQTRSKTVVLPGRRDVEAIQASNDNYLATHRPDLFAAVKRSKCTNSDRSADDPMVLTVLGKANESNGPMTSKAGDLVDPNTLPGSRNTSGYTPASSLWNKLAKSFVDSPTPGDGLVCDEDPSNYDFTYQDFPRHDGTPCLIYNENENSKVSTPDRKPRSNAGSPLKSAACGIFPDSMNLPQCKDTLTDDEFKQHLVATAAHRSPSLEEKDGDHSIDYGASDLTSSGTDEEYGEAPFSEKLERLVAMRHRHYEKERILERARQRREADERELRLRRHEMELHLDEIEASLAPRSLSRKKMDNHGSGNIVYDEAKTHRATVSDLDYDYALDRMQSSSPLGLHSPQPSSGSDEEIHRGRGRKAALPPRPTPLDNGANLVTPPKRSDSIDGRRPSLGNSKPRRSHRRSFSHGTDLVAEEKKSGSDAGDDVMTFGIGAAYMSFV